MFGVGRKAVVYCGFVRSVLVFGSELRYFPPSLVPQLDHFHNDCVSQDKGVAPHRTAHTRFHRRRLELMSSALG